MSRRLVRLVIPTLLTFAVAAPATAASAVDAAPAVDAVSAVNYVALGDSYSAGVGAAGSTGHGICSGDPWLNGLTVVPPTYSFHPDADGYARGYLPVFAAAAN